MKSFKIFAAAFAAVFFVACQGGRAVVDCTVDGAPDAVLVLKQLNGNAADVLDTVKTDASGHFRYKVKVAEGNPEFVYVYKGDSRLASLLLESGEKAVVSADTLGSYTVEGSAGSALLEKGDRAFREFLAELLNLGESGAGNAEVNRAYLKHYRESTRFVLENCKSLAVIPVLYESYNGTPVTFVSINDALVFRSVCDSLKTVYPDSKYVKALEQETARRENMFEISNRLKNAEEVAYPNLSMPSINGEKVDLYSLDAKVVMVYFWSVSDATHKMFNLEVMKPLYEKYHPLGLEIYAVCVDSDKVAWAQTVKAQDLPWINVNDGLGVASRSLSLYNVQNVPACILVSQTGLTPVPVGEKQLRKALEAGLAMKH
jgi:hypothetical protein